MYSITLSLLRTPLSFLEHACTRETPKILAFVPAKCRPRFTSALVERYLIHVLSQIHKREQCNEPRSIKRGSP
jgi:hypothetical protein